jgi:hypothetical protein
MSSPLVRPPKHLHPAFQILSAQPDGREDKIAVTDHPNANLSINPVNSCIGNGQ